MNSWELLSNPQSSARPSPATSDAESVNFHGEQLGLYAHPVTPPTPLSQHRATPLTPHQMYQSPWVSQAQDFQTPVVIDLRPDHCNDLFPTESHPVPQSPTGWNPQLSFPTSTGYAHAASSEALGHRDYSRGPSMSASSDSSAYSHDSSEPHVKTEEDPYWDGFGPREDDASCVNWYSYDPSARTSVGTDDRVFESMVKTEDGASLGLPSEYPSSLISPAMTVSPQNLSTLQTASDPRYPHRLRAPGSENLGERTIGLGIIESHEGHQSAPPDPGRFAPHFHPRRRQMSTASHRRKKRVRNEPPPGSKELQCQLCFSYFKRKYNLQKHQITHDPNRSKEFACPERKCKHRFARKADCLRHVQSVHIKSKPYKCDRCDAAFDRRDTLTRHSEDGGGCPALRKKITYEPMERKEAAPRTPRTPKPIPLRRPRVDPTLLPAPGTPLVASQPYFQHLQTPHQ